VRLQNYLIVFLFISGCGSAPLLSNSGHLISTDDESVASWEDLKKQNVIMQEFEYSCGAASLATLMQYYFDDSVTEKSLMEDINTLFTENELKVIEQAGLSFLELEKIAESKGYDTASVSLEVAALKSLKGPVLVFVKPDGYPHFAIFRGIVNNKVYLADPSRGNIKMSISDFLKEWGGETLVLGKEGFGLPQEHNLKIGRLSGFHNELSLQGRRLREQSPASLMCWPKPPR